MHRVLIPSHFGRSETTRMCLRVQVLLPMGSTAGGRRPQRRTWRWSQKRPTLCVHIGLSVLRASHAPGKRIDHHSSRATVRLPIIGQGATEAPNPSSAHKEEPRPLRTSPNNSAIGATGLALLLVSCQLIAGCHSHPIVMPHIGSNSVDAGAVAEKLRTLTSAATPSEAIR